MTARWVEQPATDGGEPYLWHYHDGTERLGSVVSLTDSSGTWTMWAAGGERGYAPSTGEARRIVERLAGEG